jgi:hypothetical protein
VAREEEGSGESYGGGRPGSDAWGCREEGGGTDRVAMMASGGEERLGQSTGGVARRGEASAARGSGGAGRRRHVARLRAAQGRRGRSTWPARAAAVCRAEEQRRKRLEEEEGD